MFVIVLVLLVVGTVTPSTAITPADTREIVVSVACHSSIELTRALPFPSILAVAVPAPFSTRTTLSVSVALPLLRSTAPRAVVVVICGVALLSYDCCIVVVELPLPLPPVTEPNFPESRNIASDVIERLVAPHLTTIHHLNDNPANNGFVVVAALFDHSASASELYTTCPYSYPTILRLPR